MKHLKRFKNWLVATYYTFRQKDENVDQAEVTSVNAADNSPASVHCAPTTPEVVEKPVELKTAVVGDTKVAITQPAETVLAKVSTPEKKVAPAPQQVRAPAIAKVQAETTPTPKISANGKNNGMRVDAGQPQSSNGKYQPGAINDQTAQRLARLLVSEIKLYYKSKKEGDATLDASNIYDILREPIEKSRAHYNQRMGKTAIENMPDYFHGELVRTLCGGDASRLGPNYPTQKSA